MPTSARSVPAVGTAPGRAFRADPARRGWRAPKLTRQSMRLFAEPLEEVLAGDAVREQAFLDELQAVVAVVEGVLGVGPLEEPAFVAAAVAVEVLDARADGSA